MVLNEWIFNRSILKILHKLSFFFKKKKLFRSNKGSDEVKKTEYHTHLLRIDRMNRLMMTRI